MHTTILIAILLVVSYIFHLFTTDSWWLLLFLTVVVDALIHFYKKNKINVTEKPVFSENNQKISEEIDDFIANPLSSSHALLLKGKWGSGKTKFIFDYLKTKNCYVYVSLFGINSIDKLHSMLVEKYYAENYQLSNYKKLINLFKKVINFFSNNTLFAEINSNLSSLPDDCIIVFDDLERSDGINIKQVLGFINRYSEHSNHSIIIIANEDELLNNDDDGSYARTKEKLIIKEYTIVPDIDCVIDLFITEAIKNTKLKEILSQESLKKRIKEIFDASQYNNLRLLRAFLHQLNWSINKVRDLEIRDEFLEMFILTYLALYFEVKSGAMTENDILNYQRFYLVPEKTPEYAKRLKSYKINFEEKGSRHIFLLSQDFWIKVIFDEILNVDVFTNEVNEFNKYYFLIMNLSELFSLLDMTYLSEDEFQVNLEIIEQKLEDGVYKDVNIIKHIAGLFITLSENSLISKDKYQIPDYFIDYIQKNNLIHYEFSVGIDLEEYSTNNFSYGYEYWNYKRPEFTEINDFIINRIENQKSRLLKNEAQKIEQKPILCLEKLNINNDNGNNSLCDKHILQYIDVDIFIQNLFQYPARDMYKILSTIDSRKTLFKNSKLDQKEIEWTEFLREKIIDSMRHDRTLSSFDKLKANLFITRLQP